MPRSTARVILGTGPQDYHVHLWGRTRSEVTACDEIPNLLTTRPLKASNLPWNDVLAIHGNIIFMTVGWAGGCLRKHGQYIGTGIYIYSHFPALSLWVRIFAQCITFLSYLLTSSGLQCIMLTI